MTQNTERLQALKSDKKFVNKAFWAYNWSIPMNFTRERMLGCSMVSMLARVADEIYPEDVEKQKELCRNHEVFFNTQQGLGAVIYGIVLGMEVERAHDDTITNELIQSIKQALAGPLAGLGDSLIQALITPILISIAIGLSTEGSILGALFLFAAYTVINAILCLTLFKTGYKYGIIGAETLVSSNMKERVIPAFEALGITVIGGVLAGIMSQNRTGRFLRPDQHQHSNRCSGRLLSKDFDSGHLLHRVLSGKRKEMVATKIMLWMIPVAIIGYMTTILA